MRIRFLTIAVSLMLCLVLMASPGLAQSAYPDYKAVYDEWRRQVDAHPLLSLPPLFPQYIGDSDLRNATLNLLSIGPNLTPFIVEEIRTETDLHRQNDLMSLLNRVSGVNLYFCINAKNIWNAAPALIKQFIAKWDSGDFLKASELLKSEWKDPVDGTAPKKIDPCSIIPIRRYGVYALPFIFESLNQRNSSKLFAAYLIITGESDLYAQYIQSPLTMFQTPGEKLSHIKAWARENETKFDKLGALHTQIKAIAIQ
ncbi:MAG: hypothetical protein J2P21_13310 [Chloracidobacterium sp.]|nr:hypothetical protein [Chloracidobacterium sp.]